MAKVIQIIDVDSDGHKVRLDDGRVVRMPHGGEQPHIGHEIGEPDDVKAPTIEQLNSDAQLQAQELSTEVHEEE